MILNILNLKLVIFLLELREAIKSKVTEQNSRNFWELYINNVIPLIIDQIFSQVLASLSNLEITIKSINQISSF